MSLSVPRHLLFNCAGHQHIPPGPLRDRGPRRFRTSAFQTYVGPPSAAIFLQLAAYTQTQSRVQTSFDGVTGSSDDLGSSARSASSSAYSPA